MMFDISLPENAFMILQLEIFEWTFNVNIQCDNTLFEYVQLPALRLLGWGAYITQMWQQPQNGLTGLLG
jgi:hypothetical protein